MVISKVFIANRGEIAVRIARACQQLGIPSVAAFSVADRDALHTRSADEAICVGPAPASQSYLHIPSIIDAARRTGADAIHPGYGFLAENAAFAEACFEAGIVFIGPGAAVLRLLGDKVSARRQMRDAGVPVVPGTFEASSDPDVLERVAREMGLPVLVKATGGGGGMGMRRVESDDALRPALEEATAEARAAFGNPDLYVEKLFLLARHVEVQILADAHGNVITLGERECSVQRRHQKVIEESPSPAVEPVLRAALCDAARQAARAAGYVGAGTVEFLLAPDGAFYFLEVNARIQVEHPVTEARFGIDLVAWQIRIANGEPLDPALGGTPHGWAMEARLYAEDPALGFLPSPGTILHLELPAGPGIRVDAGIVTGSEVPTEYDPILAKIIAHGECRESCRRRLVDALTQTVVLGVASNASYLRGILEHPRFVEGRLHTRVLEDEIAPDLAVSDPIVQEAAIVAAAIALARAPSAGGPGQGPARIPGPWQVLRGVFPGGSAS